MITCQVCVVPLVSSNLPNRAFVQSEQDDATCVAAHTWLQCVQDGEPSEDVLLKASYRISSALACAGRHTALRTTSIRLDAMAVWHSLSNLQDQPKALTGPTILANVVCLELLLYSYIDGKIENEIDIRHFTCKLLQRLPKLTAARLHYHSYSEVPYIPLLQLKHLDLELGGKDSLGCMPFAALMPALETARITFVVGLGRISELNVLGCQHLMRLVLNNAVVHQLSKPQQCWLRVDMPQWNAYSMQPSQLQQSLSEVNEILLYSREFHAPQGLLAHVCLPKLETLQCEWNEDSGEDSGVVSNAIQHCLEHSGNLPALKSILCQSIRCQSYGQLTGAIMRARIPADLADVHELMFATAGPLQLTFECARSAGEKLNTFCAVGSVLLIDNIDLSSMYKALLRRGLTLSTAHADDAYDDIPSQCMYIRAFSAPRLSYDDAIDAVNSRVSRWGGYWGCAECGACFDCLREAGMLNDR